MHTALLTSSGADADLVEALRHGAALADPRLDAVRAFTLAVLDRTGAVSEGDLRAFVEAGFTARSALEVVLGIGAYTISTFVNRMTGAPLDAPFEVFAWEPATAS
jgi:alkylhydroperoxidase family enzyme